MPGFGEILKQARKEYPDAFESDRFRLIAVGKNYSEYEKAIRERLEVKTLTFKKSDRSLLTTSLDLGFAPDGDTLDDYALEAEIEIQRRYLQKLEDDDAIKKFKVVIRDAPGLPPERVVIAEIKLYRYRFLDYLRGEKRRKIPEFFCKKGICFLKFSKNLKIKCLDETRQSGFLRAFFRESGFVSMMTIEGLFNDFMHRRYDAAKGVVSSKDIYGEEYLGESDDRLGEQRRIISNTIKEIQTKLKKAGVKRGTIRFELLDREVLIKL